jgi:hypothetical protein
MRQDPFDFDQFYGSTFLPLVGWLEKHGVPNGEAEEMAQEVMLALSGASQQNRRTATKTRKGSGKTARVSRKKPSVVTDPEGWVYRRARWRVRDWYCSGRVRLEQALVVERDGEEADRQIRAQADDLDDILWARQLIAKKNAEFWQRLEEHAESLAHIVKAVQEMMRKRAPDDALKQFLESRVLILSGKVTNGSKRDSGDIQDLAKKLGITTGALRTAFTRIKGSWKNCERGLFQCV